MSFTSRMFPCCTHKTIDHNTPMTPLFDSVFSPLFGEKDIRLLMVGKKGAGKSAILHHLGVDDRVTSQITDEGFTVEQLQYKNVHFTVCDVGGGSHDLSPYVAGVVGLIYVVDSSDHETLPEAKDQLQKLQDMEELKHATVLVFANKQDAENTLTSSEVADKLNMHSNVHPCVAHKGEGVQDALKDFVMHAMGGLVSPIIISNGNV